MTKLEKKFSLLIIFSCYRNFFNNESFGNLNPVLDHPMPLQGSQSKMGKCGLMVKMGGLFYSDIKTNIEKR